MINYMNSFLVELNVAANGRTSAFKRHGCNCVRQHLISNLEQGIKHEFYA